MLREDRLNAFIVAHTARTRSMLRRLSAPKRWLYRAATVAAALLACAAVYGLYGLAQEAGAGTTFIVIVFGVGAIGGVSGYIYYRLTLSLNQKEKRIKEKQVNVSKITESFISLILSKRDAENMVGDLQEELYALVKIKGPLKSRIWLYRQIFNSALPLLINKIRRLVLRLTKSLRRS